MRGEIVCIGDELLSGRVKEINARYAAARLTPLGLTVERVVIVGDQAEAIRDALTRAVQSAQFVLVTGGLGSTTDDITAASAAQVFDLPLAESRRMVQNLRTWFEAQGQKMSQEMRKLAWLPQGAEILSARCAGFRLTSPQGRPVYFLPGVPHEMRGLFDKKVLPELTRLAGGGQGPVVRELRIFGIPESEVGARLGGLEREGVGLGYYPDFPEISLVISVRNQDAGQAESLAGEMESEASRRLEGYVVSRGGERLEEKVARLLTQRGLTLALAESCTGGLIGHRLTEVPGASAFLERGLVVYSNQAKQDLLGVSAQTLAQYGAVSAQTASEMAQGARRSGSTSLGLAVTGIAGPEGGSPEKPVGTVFVGLAAPEGVRTGGFRFPGNRGQVKLHTSSQALDWLRRYLEEDAFIHGA